MNEMGTKSGAHWTAFAAALLFFLYRWLTAMLGMLLGDCTGPGNQGCFASKDT